MAVLHPLECYLLESFSSPEHFAATRDAIIEWIDAHEAAFSRLQSNLDPRQRSKPQWQQGDIVWDSCIAQYSARPRLLHQGLYPACQQ